MSNLAIIILAAGKGTRMHSSKPKVLHPLSGNPWLLRLIKTAKYLNPNKIFIVVSPDNRAEIELALTGEDCELIEQTQTLGTGHAVLQAVPKVEAENALILLGDTPLLEPESLWHLVKQTPVNGIGMLTFEPHDPTGLGRVLRDTKGDVMGIKEEKDANATEKTIREVAVGTYYAPTTLLATLLPTVKNNNASGEYYLPDVVPLAIAAKHPVVAVKMNDAMQGFGINTKHQLSIAERYLRHKQIEHLMGQGVTVMDPNRVDIRGHVSVKQDVTLDVNVILEGDVFIGEGTTIGAHTILRNARIGDFVTIAPYSMIEDSIVENHCIIGPYARIRPGCHVHEHAHVGNFVELKKTQLGAHSKANHLSYVGDAIVGEKVNIGAGTITCNYDGVTKHQTVIENGAFIGSNSALVAPVIVGENAVIGAGTVLTNDAPADQLTLARAQQVTVEDWSKK